MRILHYFLGFPPYRTGGLTKISYDLMTSQQKQNNEVFALWPGKIDLLNKRVRIVSKGFVDGVQSYELVNPLPVPLDEGVKEIDLFTKEYSGHAYDNFLCKLKPDVIHIHTLMGLHRELIDAAKRQKIKTVFTSHDYYGICPKVTLYRYGTVCKDDHNCKDCVKCNVNALSFEKIMIMQSPLYRTLKDSKIIKFLRDKHRTEFFSEEKMPEIFKSEQEIEIMADKYRALRKYYTDILSDIDLIHFNSSIAEKVYNKYIKATNSVVLSITHKDICDHRNISHSKDSCLRLTCLAPAKPFKGYNVMKQALDELWESGKRDFVLNMFGQVPQPTPYMRVNDGLFEYSNLRSIMENTDVLLAPSIWYETFGFTVLEALSFAVPVIVTDHVGAKDIVKDGGIIVESASVEAIKNAVASLTPAMCEQMRTNIRKNVEIKTWEMFLGEIYQLYNSQIGL